MKMLNSQDESQFLGFGKEAKERRQAKREIRLERKQIRNDKKSAKVEKIKTDTALTASQANAVNSALQAPATASGINAPNQNIIIFSVVGVLVVAVIVVIILKFKK